MKTIFFLVVLAACGLGAAAGYMVKENRMHAISVDIGKNIGKVAKESGAPRFSVQSFIGLTFYEIVDMPVDIRVRYVRPGYEITAKPLFALTMAADSENNNDMAVEVATLQFSRHVAKSHEEARKVISDLLTQFNKSRWRRHIDATCPAVTDRSAYLNISGEIDGSCPLDPAYMPSADEWPEVMRNAKHYEWLGDGVLARLTVSFDEDSRGLTYNITLEFQDFERTKRRSEADHARELVEGDQKGWNSTENHKKRMDENKIKIKILEHHAVGRGDTVVSRE
jgi:hypothetical protein